MALNELQKEFHELGNKKAQIEADNQALQNEYDALRGQQVELNAQLMPIKEKLRQAKAPIYDIDVRRAQISRSLQGKTGKPE